MGKSSAKTPTYPDPTTTAAAQQSINDNTALFNAGINNVNQVTPYGNETYTLNDQDYQNALNEFNTTGQWSSPGLGTSGALPTESEFNPTYTSTITLSPQEQALFNQQTANQTQAGQLAGSVLGQAQTALSSPIDYSSFTPIPGSGDLQSSEQDAISAQQTLLAPQMAQQDQAIQSQLANQGITPGSQAYNNQYNNYNNLKAQTLANETLNAQQYASTAQQTALAARNQQINEAESSRNDPLNEYQALAGGSQVTNPTFSSPTNYSAQPANLSSLVEQQYQAQLAAANASNSSSNSLTGSLLGLGGSFLGNSSLGSLFGGAGAAAGTAGDLTSYLSAVGAFA